MRELTVTSCATQKFKLRIFELRNFAISTKILIQNKKFPDFIASLPGFLQCAFFLLPKQEHLGDGKSIIVWTKELIGNSFVKNMAYRLQ